jgi:hypothetical protein
MLDGRGTNRRTALIAVLLMIGSVSLAQENQPRAIVGAIRRDAWTGCSVTEKVARTLCLEQYHEARTFFRCHSKYTLLFDG